MRADLGLPIEALRLILSRTGRPRLWARTWTDGKVTIAPITSTTPFPEISRRQRDPSGSVARCLKLEIGKGIPPMARVNGTVKFFNHSRGFGFISARRRRQGRVRTRLRARAFRRAGARTKATKSPSRSRTTAAAAASRPRTSSSPKPRSAQARLRTDPTAGPRRPAVFCALARAGLTGDSLSRPYFAVKGRLTLHSRTPDKSRRPLPTRFAGAQAKEHRTMTRTDSEGRYARRA